MRKPKKEKTPRRIGGMIDPGVDDASRVKLNQHLELFAAAITVEASPDLDLAEAKAKMSAAKKAFMADPSTENKIEAKYAREEWEKAEKTHFLSIDKDKGFKQVRNKMMSMELKAEELKKRIQLQPAKRLECQARADGMGVLKCDQETAKMEGQYALAIHEANRYKSMMGEVLTGKGEGMSYSERGAKISLSQRMRNSKLRGDHSLAAKLAEERLALQLNDTRKFKEAPKEGAKAADRKGLKLKSDKEVSTDAALNELRKQLSEKTRRSSRTEAQKRAAADRDKPQTTKTKRSARDQGLVNASDIKRGKSRLVGDDDVFRWEYIV